MSTGDVVLMVICFYIMGSLLFGLVPEEDIEDWDRTTWATVLFWPISFLFLVGIFIVRWIMGENDG
jgi:hypothetical protein